MLLIVFVSEIEICVSFTLIFQKKIIELILHFYNSYALSRFLKKSEHYYNAIKHTHTHFLFCAISLMTRIYYEYIRMLQDINIGASVIGFAFLLCFKTNLKVDLYLVVAHSPYVFIESLSANA